MSGEYYSRARFVFLFLLLVALLVLRKPDLIASPQLFAEDATVFFREQMVFPGTAIFLPYNGQFHLVPRLIALLEGILPLAAAALVCSMASVLIHAFCLSVFFLPWNRWLVANDLLRAAACVVMATALHGAEMIGFSGPLMWYLLLAGMLLLFRPEKDAPESPRGRSIAVASMAAVGLSAAPAILLTPIAVWLAVKRRGTQRAVALALVASLAVQSYALVFGKRTDAPPKPKDGIPLLLAQIGTATVVSCTYVGVIAPLAGMEGALAVNKVRNLGPALAVVMALTALITWLLCTSPPAVRRRLAIGLYAALGTLASALYTRNLIWLSLSINNTTSWATPARYMVLPGAMLVYMACLSLERLPWRDARLQAACLLLIFAAGIHGNFKQPPYPDFPWKAAYPKISAWRAVHAQGKLMPLLVPIAPAPWVIDLP